MELIKKQDLQNGQLIGHRLVGKMVFDAKTQFDGTIRNAFDDGTFTIYWYGLGQDRRQALTGLQVHAKGF